MEVIKASDYNVEFGAEGYNSLNELISRKSYSKLFILVDENTFENCYPKFIPNLESDISIEVIEIDAGEEFKNLKTCIGVWDAITELGGDRKSLLLTLGGGVITDLGGFVASCFKRGIDFVNIPTTLLSMVDASVGGKTGVDLGVLKNQIGVFANPELVIIDSKYLSTLDQRDFTSGLAEVIKYALTFDKSLLSAVTNIQNANLDEIIHKSIVIKNNVVLKDPKEGHLRKVLNFGHTLGHAIESFYLESADKESLTHGEAIAIGMICESYLSHKVLGFSLDAVNQIKKDIFSVFDKITLVPSDYSSILTLLKHDKKNVKGKTNYVLLQDFEHFKIDVQVDEELLSESLEYYNQ